jgi:hypothetical protein
VQTSPDRSSWYFVDESGDPTYFNRRGEVIVGREGCSPILLIGFVAMTEPHPARVALSRLRAELVGDRYLKAIPSLKKSAKAFHAKDDCPEVRQAAYKLIDTFDFRYQCVVARKHAAMFREVFKGSPGAFYDHLVTHLFKNVLHRSSMNKIYFSRRGDRARKAPLEEAIRRGIEEFERSTGTTVDTDVHLQCQTPASETCLQIVDYMNWAVYRAYTMREMRYFEFMREKVDLLVDLYDRTKYPRNYYDRGGNPFEIEKTSSL